MSNLSLREQKRRYKIKANILEAILSYQKKENLYYSVDTLKKNSVHRVSTEVLEKIIQSSDLFENINQFTGTTRLSGFPIEIEYTLETTNTLQISNANIGGRTAYPTREPEILENAIMTYDGYIEILIEANPGQGTWKLNISDITQFLSDGSTRKLEVVSTPQTSHPLIKVVAVDEDRFYPGALKTNDA